MSEIGGARLGQPGVQADIAEGVPPLPAVGGYSWLVADAGTGKVLAAKNAHWKLAPASTLKMLFANTLLPKLDRNMTHRVSPSELSAVGEGSSTVGIRENETYKVEDLWRGVFLRSGNDAVHVLCALNGGVPNTVRQMNERARQLQALDTNVVSPDGYDAVGQVSSAYDLALFAREGLRDKDFRYYAGLRVAQFPGLEGESFQIQNTNTMLGEYRGMIGVKNGYTTHAGNTFVGAAERDGRTLLVSIMHVDGKGKTYADTAKLLDWGFAASAIRPVGELVNPLPGTGEAEGGKTERPPVPGHVPAGDLPSPGVTAAKQVSSVHGGFNWALWMGIGAPAALLLGGAALLAMRGAGRDTRGRVRFMSEIRP